jgi:hypothetical protein
MDGHGSVGANSVGDLLKIGEESPTWQIYPMATGLKWCWICWISPKHGHSIVIPLLLCCHDMPTQHTFVIERLSPGVVLSSLKSTLHPLRLYLDVCIYRPPQILYHQIHTKMRYITNYLDMFTIFPSFSLFTWRCSHCSHCSKGIPEGVSGLLGHRLLGAGQLEGEESKISKDPEI